MSPDPLSLFVFAVCGVWLWLCWVWNRAVNYSTDLPFSATTDRPLPQVSVIIAACDEADTIEPALSSLLAQKLEGLEIVVANDRSQDQTGAILDRMAAGDDRLKVIHINELPSGWLGKVHAIHRATETARGEWLLYTDADVIFNPGIIERAVNHARANSLDHLALMPTVEAPTLALDITLTAFAKLLFFAINAGSNNQKPFGAGAFNLVRREALDRSEGLKWLRMEVADDAGLALLIVNAGGSTQFLLALDGIRLCWYPSLGAMFRGLEKNSFVVTSRGSIFRAIAIVCAYFAGIAGPIVGLAIQPSRVATWVSAVALAAIVGAAFRIRRRLKLSPWPAALAPAGLVFVGACWIWSGLCTLYKRGIHWRGTFYPLAEIIEGQRVKL